MSSSNYDDYSSSPPRVKRRGKKDIKFKIPENTISDMSAYMASFREKLEKNLEGDEGTSSEQSSSYDSSYDRQPPPRRVIPDSPNSTRVQMVEDFMKHAEESDNWLEKWYSENYEKVNHYDILRFELLYLLGEYLPGLKVNEDIHPNALIATIKEFVIDLYTKFNKFNLELREISGHEVAGYIHDHQRKVIEVVEDYENLLLTANEEIAQCKDQIAHLDAELAAALKKKFKVWEWEQPFMVVMKVLMKSNLWQIYKAGWLARFPEQQHERRVGQRKKSECRIAEATEALC
ncbi:uncharacterized protein CEXT_182171 [Caerostris extrusa]|uniref:Uncharacterized protein n=1 Tax=Caerostris extrusa TaxID=172846 RepID=A0AAV4N137_CAEEX|nr:uncharacterized protein CEXT_182171 [Caerostris extrusa]